MKLLVSEFFSVHLALFPPPKTAEVGCFHGYTHQIPTTRNQTPPRLTYAQAQVLVLFVIVEEKKSVPDLYTLSRGRDEYQPVTNRDQQ